MPIQLEADTGANITVMTAKYLDELDWVEIEDTNMHIQEYNGKAEPCFGKTSINFKRVNCCTTQIVYFSHKAVANFLSIDACMALAFVPSDFPYAEVNVVMETQSGSNGLDNTKCGMEKASKTKCGMEKASLNQLWNEES